MLLSSDSHLRDEQPLDLALQAVYPRVQCEGFRLHCIVHALVDEPV